MTETLKSIIKENQLRHNLNEIVDEWGALKVIDQLAEVLTENFTITKHEGFYKLAWELTKISKDYNYTNDKIR